MESENFIKNRLQGRLKPVRISTASGEEMEETEEEQPLSPWATAFREAGSDLYVICILGLTVNVEPSFLKQNLLHSLLSNPRFSSLQVTDGKTGKMKWVKTSINLEEHMIIPEVKPNMDSSSNTFLDNYLSNLSKVPMDNSKPLWELHLLNNLRTPDYDSVVIIRVHHSLGDGFTLLFQLLSSTRKLSDPQSLPSFPMKRKSTADVKGFWRYYLMKFWSVIVLFWNTMFDVIMLMATMWFLKDTKTPLSRSDCSKPISRRFVCKIFILDDIKLIKNSTNATINDVILAVIQSGLSLYLNRKYDDGQVMRRATEKDNNLPKNVRLRAIVPVTLRLPKFHDVPGKMEDIKSKDKKGNQFGYVLLPLTIAIKDDPLDYVRSAKAAMDRKKNSLEAIATSTFTKFLLQLFGVKGASIFSHKIPSHTTMVFSNMPGPREEIAYHGCPISFMAPTSYGLPSALSMHVLSYFDKVSIMLSVDENTIPDPHQLGTDLEDAFKLIKNAAIATTTS